MEKYSTEAEKVDAGQKLAQPAPAAPAFVYDKKAEDKLRLKIDLFVVPTVALLYLFCFIDVSTSSQAYTIKMAPNESFAETVCSTSS